MSVRFKISTAEFPDDAVAVTRAEVDGELTILIVSRTGMCSRSAAEMASELLTMDERDEFRRQCGLVTASEYPGFDVWNDVAVEDATVGSEHWVGQPA